MRISELWTQGKQQLVSFMRKSLLLVCAVLISNVALAVEKKEEIVPVRINCPAPVMPVKAQALRIEGSVDYAAWVNDKGDVYSVDITGDEVFFRETQIAIKKCKFKPGHPGVYRDSIKFSLVKP
ncbi:TPA: hypothetical protein QHR34_002828 [Raoultella ornithinolytica]|nr:hypothetical protein [Raoultella ornithinolytica]HDT1248684.1 hypothetical protein [Raoultella ornithinolytica]